MKSRYSNCYLAFLVLVLVAVLIQLSGPSLQVSKKIRYDQLGGGCFLGMGDCGSKAETTITQTNNQNFMTLNEFNKLNETTNKAVASSIVKSAMNSGGYAVTRQEMEFGDITASNGGTVDIGKISQTQQATINFSTINQTSATNDAATSFANTVLDEIKNKVDTDVQSKMDAEAAAKATAGFLQTAAADAKSSIVQTNNITVDTRNIQNISNVLKNEVQNNFTTDTLNQTILSTTVNQVLKIRNITATDGGTVKIDEIAQKSAIELIAKNQNITTATNKILNNVLASCGVKIDQSNSTATKTEQSAAASAEAVGKGPLDFLGDIMKYVIIAGLILAVVIIVGVIAYFLISGESPMDYVNAAKNK